MSRVLVSTVPFGQHNRVALDLLESCSENFTLNPTGRRLREDELAKLAVDAEILIAGTEPITARVMDAAPGLKLIARVGIGLDNVDLLAARERGIAVTYTPEAPAPAVAELTVGLMLSLLRHIHQANLAMHHGEWQRFMGRRISDVTIGIIGTGRIGRRVLRHLGSFGSPRILVNDLESTPNLLPELELEWVSKDIIYREADVISLHLPLTRATRNMISARHLQQMKSDALLINTSRGGIVNEEDLFVALREGRLGGVAIDVFNDEPYSGPLSQASNCLLTSHMGSMSEGCRMRMEIEATQEVFQYIRGLPLHCPVPENEYQNQVAQH